MWEWIRFLSNHSAFFHVGNSYVPETFKLNSKISEKDIVVSNDLVKTNEKINKAEVGIVKLKPTRNKVVAATNIVAVERIEIGPYNR